MNARERFSAVTPIGLAVVFLGSLFGLLGMDDSRDWMKEKIFRRGTVTMHLELDPLRLLGPGTDLSMHDGVLSGMLASARYDVTLADSRAEGTGPNGKVALAIARRSDQTLEMTGVWNGQNVDLVFGEHSMKGKLVHHLAGSEPGILSCQYDLDEVKGTLVSGLATCLGHDMPLRYTIDPGSSVKWNRSDVALLIVAYLSAAPAPPPFN